MSAGRDDRCCESPALREEMVCGHCGWQTGLRGRSGLIAKAVREAEERLEAERDALRTEVEQRQKAIDSALSWMRDSECVGGPTERATWRHVLRVLGPFATEHQGQDPERAREALGDRGSPS